MPGTAVGSGFQQIRHTLQPFPDTGKQQRADYQKIYLQEFLSPFYKVSSPLSPFRLTPL